MSSSNFVSSQAQNSTTNLNSQQQIHQQHLQLQLKSPQLQPQQLQPQQLQLQPQQQQLQPQQQQQLFPGPIQSGRIDQQWSQHLSQPIQTTSSNGPIWIQQPSHTTTQSVTTLAPVTQVQTYQAQPVTSMTVTPIQTFQAPPVTTITPITTVTPVQSFQPPILVQEIQTAPIRSAPTKPSPPAFPVSLRRAAAAVKSS